MGSLLGAPLKLTGRVCAPLKMSAIATGFLPRSSGSKAMLSWPFPELDSRALSTLWPRTSQGSGVGASLPWTSAMADGHRHCISTAAYVCTTGGRAPLSPGERQAVPRAGRGLESLDRGNLGEGKNPAPEIVSYDFE